MFGKLRGEHVSEANAKMQYSREQSEDDSNYEEFHQNLYIPARTDVYRDNEEAKDKGNTKFNKQMHNRVFKLGAYIFEEYVDELGTSKKLNKP